MKNRTTVTIYDMDFTLVGEEAPEYVEKIAAHVDGKMRELGSDSGLSVVASAILAAVNIADEYFKNADSSEHLRAQLKDYFDELSRLKDENYELKRELQRIKIGRPSGMPEPDASAENPLNKMQETLKLGDDK